jgi:hypothetical protein
MDNLLSVLGLSGGATVFLWGLWENRDAQKRRELEFVAAERKEFESKVVVQNSMDIASL